MKLAIMQPYLFPYIGYWQLLNIADEWVFFDVVKYSKKSWMNRNRILHPDQNKQFQYITVPIKKHENGSLINKVRVNNNENWRDKVLGQLTVYKRLKAPFYVETIELIQSIFATEYDLFLSLVIESVKKTACHLDIDLDYKIASDLNFDRDEISGPGDWALAISKSQEADKYINPYSGHEIFDENKFRKNGIELRFLRSGLSEYKQSWREKYVEGLSIIDVMMFNSKEEIRTLLDNDFLLLNKKNLVMELGNG